MSPDPQHKDFILKISEPEALHQLLNSEMYVLVRTFPAMAIVEV
jgi:hypothetical protein